MAIAISNLTYGDSGVGGGTSFSSSSISPSSNALVLLSVSSRTGISTDPNIPTVTGNGLTWVQVATLVFDTTSSSRRRLTVFRAMGASPSNGAVTVDFAGQTQTDYSYAVDQSTGTDTTGTNGSGAIVQSVSNSDESGSASSITATLAAFSNAGNATFGAFAEAATFGFTVGSGFTLLGAATGSADTGIMCNTEYKLSNDTTVDGSWSGAGEIGCIAIEINAQGTSTTANLRMLMGMGT